MSALNRLNIDTPREPWIHLELGAANYGVEGFVNGKCRGGHENQLLPLYHTIDELVQTHGPNTPGIFYVNDLRQDACDYACERLRGYILKEYPKTAIRVASIAKNYFELDVLQDCHVAKLDSIHFKNPEKRHLANAVSNFKWLLAMSQSSFSSLTLVSGYQEVFSPNPYLHRAGKKSELLLRYEEDLMPPLKYLYINPNGTIDPEWEKRTKRYSIRMATLEELYTPAETSERERQKKLTRVQRVAKNIFTQTIGEKKSP